MNTFEKRNNLDESINIPIRLKKDLWSRFRNLRQNYNWSTIQCVFKIRESARFHYRTNPQSVCLLRPNPSIRKPIHPSPPGYLDIGAPSLPSSFETSSCSTLSTGANFRSPRWTAVWYMFRGRVPALVVSCPTHLIRFRHYGRNRRNRGWKWWLAKGNRKPDQPRGRSITGIDHDVTVTQCK